MSSFARASFDVAGYLACRPSYPPRIIDIILKYHAQRGGRFERAVDVGCGPGFVALELAPHFEYVSGIDPARKMVDIGLQPAHADSRSIAGSAGGAACTRIEYKVGSAEDLGAAGFAEQTQAAHWFDHAKTWDQLSRYVRPGGTVAYIGYGELLFPHHPALSPLIAAHSRFFWAGGHWQSGRRVVEELFDPIPFPCESETSRDSTETDALLRALPPLEEAHLHPLSISDSDGATPAAPLRTHDSAWHAPSGVRIKADRTTGAGAEGGPAPWLMKKRFSRANLEGYLRTQSALHEYHQKHPEDAARRGEGAEGDIIDGLVHKIWEGRMEEGSKGDEGENEIMGAWPAVLMMIKRSQ